MFAKKVPLTESIAVPCGSLIGRFHFISHTVSSLFAPLIFLLVISYFTLIVSFSSLFLLSFLPLAFLSCFF